MPLLQYELIIGLYIRPIAINSNDIAIGYQSVYQKNPMLCGYYPAALIFNNNSMFSLGHRTSARLYQDRILMQLCHHFIKLAGVVHPSCGKGKSIEL